MNTKLHPMLLLLALLPLSGCGWPFGVAATVGGDYLTRPDDLPPADTASQIAPHESWCYKTLGTVECYTEPQDTSAGRLMNVEPANRYPLTGKAYAETVTQSQLANAPKAVAKPDDAPDQTLGMTPVQPAEVTPMTPKVEPKPVIKYTAKKPHHKHKKAKKAAKPPAALANPAPKIPN